MIGSKRDNAIIPLITCPICGTNDRITFSTDDNYSDYYTCLNCENEFGINFRKRDYDFRSFIRKMKYRR